MTYPSLNLDTTMTGPKDSSLAMNMWSSTSVNTVGSIKKPKGKLLYWLLAKGYSDSKASKILKWHKLNSLNSAKQSFCQTSPWSWRKVKTCPTGAVAICLKRLSVYSTWSVHLFASIHQRSSLLYSNLTVLHQLVQVGFVILWAVVCGAIQWVSNLHLLDLFHLWGKEWWNRNKFFHF